MCGVAGCYVAAETAPDRQLVDAMTDEQYRRGPDNRAVEEATAPCASVVMGHNRLSIIDLSDDANQPMSDALDTLRIAYNGEIYNFIELRDELRADGHAFRTESDTEVILEAFRRWGPDSFERLNGMFAIALFDRRDGRLWLVRDRFGVKPLYYTLNGDSLVFASTPGAIANELGSDPNLEYVSRGLHYWIYEDDSGISPYVGVHAVPPGSYVVASAVRSGRPTVVTQRWYDFEARVRVLRDELKLASDHDLVPRFAETLRQSVSVRLRADVPIGISLSGGLDSSAIATVASSMGAATTAFSYGDASDYETEGPLVATTARALGIPVTYAKLDDAERVAAYWETLDAQGAPFPDTSIVAQYAVFKAAHRAELKVLLGGQGSDEALMGYRKFQLVLLREAAREGNLPAFLRLAGGMSLMLRAELPRASTYMRQRDRYVRQEGLRTTIRLPKPQGIQMLGDVRQPGWRRQIDDMLRVSLPTLLRYEDRNSTWNSLETRLPRGETIESVFSDDRLTRHPTAFAEATTLAWLGRHG